MNAVFLGGLQKEGGNGGCLWWNQSDQCCEKGRFLLLKSPVVVISVPFTADRWQVLDVHDIYFIQSDTAV